MNNISVIKRVAALQGMSGEELKNMWREFHETEPPPFNRAFLVKRLAYKIQEFAHGGLLEETKNRLENRAPEDYLIQERKQKIGENLLPGTRLIREWKGQDYCCTVLEEGFEHQGRRFKSLSAVANFITGTRWNGFVFFGLKKQGVKS